MLQPNPTNSAAIVRARLKARNSQQPLSRQTATSTQPASEPEAQHRQRSATFEQLAREVRQLETGGRDLETQPSISAGCSALDDCLPHRGYLPGSIIEYLRVASGCGASYLAFAAAASAMRASDGFLVIASTHHNVYPPSLLCHGIPLDRTIFVRPESEADLIWTIDQSLRTSAVAAVVAELEVLDDRSARRLQLAAEHGKGVGLLLRSLAARRSPSWAEVQWMVRGSAWPRSRFDRGSGRQLDVKLARVRGGGAGATLHLKIDATTGELTTREIATPPNVRERNRHERQGTASARRPNAQPGSVRLATELASTASPSRRAQTG